MKAPTISVSEHDRYRTRENEGPCICEGCDNEPETCGMNPDDCLATLAEAGAEERFEAMRDAYD